MAVALTKVKRPAAAAGVLIRVKRPAAVGKQQKQVAGSKGPGRNVTMKRTARG